MNRLTRTLLWSVVGGYLAFRSYQGLAEPSTDALWFNPYVNVVAATLAFIAALRSWRKTYNPEKAASATPVEPPTRIERIIFRVLALGMMAVGLVFLSIGCWMARDEWIRVAQWPRTYAILVSKHISPVGARMVFHYEVGGRRFTGLGFRFGSEKEVRTALESYEPGTMQRISYDPEDHGQVETNLTYNWNLFRPAVFSATVGAACLIVGILLFREARGNRALADDATTRPSA
ncbi:MAG: DUF3592 domain-containing protein [Bryobacteraceae bacterium]|jgi:hypothetical protein